MPPRVRIQAVLTSVGFVLLVLFVLPCCADAKASAYQLDCNMGKGKNEVITLKSVTVQLLRSGNACRVEIRDKNGKLFFTQASWGLQVSPVLTSAEAGSYLMVQDDASPIQLFILGLGPEPHLLTKVRNGYGFWIDKGCSDGRQHIWTADDAFRGDPEFADVYLQDLFVPEVALEVSGDSLVDMTPACKPHFDQQIAAMRSGATVREFRAFRDRRLKDAFRSAQVKGYVLKIVSSYLYSGREELARSNLHSMWPAEDEERVWKWLVRKRSEGILARLNTTTM